MAPDDHPPPRRRSMALSVLVGDALGRPTSAPGLARWLARVSPAGARGSVSLALVSDQRVRRLNREYLGHDYATDVLSFPGFARTAPPRASAGQAPVAEGRAWARPARVTSPVPSPQSRASVPFLGDIVIARGVARRQAREAGHSERTELRVLALHGLLHLLGYDHERDQGQMHRVEQRLRRKGGLREGLIERSARPGRGARRP